MPNSKPVKIDFIREGSSEKWGPFFSFNVTFENGDAGQYLSKVREQTAFVLGQPLDYTLEPNANPQYLPRIKPARATGKFQANPATQFKICALTCAVNLVAAKIITENQLQKTYKKFISWLNE
jgi:hypothetical protein